MNATDTFIEEYRTAVTDGANVASVPLADACCTLVRQLRSDGFLVDQVISYVNEKMEEAGGKRGNTQRLDRDLSEHCVAEYFRPPPGPPAA